MDSISLPSGFGFSQSSLQDYVDCPRRFQLRYIEKLQWPAVETEPILEFERHQKEGQLFHRMVQQHLLGLPVDLLSRQAKTPDLSRWWENYRGYDFKLDNYTLHTELTLNAPVGNWWLLAKYDLISCKSGGQAIIYDWKTSHKRPRDEWVAVRMQTRVYRSMLIHAGAFLNNGSPFDPDQTEMIYWYADHPSEPAQFPYNPTQFKRDWESLTGLMKEIGNHRYFPLTDDESKCAYCPYRSYCNRGIKAGVTEDFNETEYDTTDFNFEQIAEIEF